MKSSHIFINFSNGWLGGLSMLSSQQTCKFRHLSSHSVRHNGHSLRSEYHAKLCVLIDISVAKRYRQVVMHKQRAEQITNNYDNMAYNAEFFFLLALPCTSSSTLWYNQACSFPTSLFTVLYHQERICPSHLTFTHQSCI